MFWSEPLVDVIGEAPWYYIRKKGLKAGEAGQKQPTYNAEYRDQPRFSSNSFFHIFVLFLVSDVSE